MREIMIKDPKFEGEDHEEGLQTVVGRCKGMDMAELESAILGAR